MVDFSRDPAYKRAASNPAGPSGLQQTATRISEGRAAYARGESPLQPWQPERSWLDTARSWYTGANSQSTQNGWDSDFWRQSWANIDTYYTKAAETGQGSQFFSMFDHDRATGVAMWDDPNGRYKFGDVFLNGQLARNEDGSTANLYTDYDKPTADVMMGEFMFTRQEKEGIFRHGDREARMADAVAERRDQWSEQAKYAPQAEQYQRDVDTRQEQFTQGVVDDVGAFALGAGASATTGAAAAAMTAAGAAALGFSWTGPGALLAAAIAGTVGGAAAWLNKDQLSTMAARAYVDTERAWEHNHNPVTTVGAAIGNASSLAMRAASPLSNLYQGAYDVASPGGWGDAEAGFYRTNAEGERVAGGIAQGVDVVLSIGDGALQFSSRAAARLFQVTMGAAVAGGVNDQLMGATFNPARGSYDPFDRSGERWAALGSTGIDLAQLGMARALGTAAAGARGAATGTTTEAGWLADRLTAGGDRVYARLRGQGDTFAPGATRFETLNGIRFGLDENLNVVGSRMTMQALVPSEFMRWLPTSWQARRTALNANRSAPTRDDFYEAAWQMTSKGSRFNSAIINGYAEGSEEFVQALLDPWAISEAPTMQQVVTAALYGAAGGIGMSLGQVNVRPEADAFARERAYALATLRLGGPPDRAEFDQMWAGSSQLDRRRMATMRPSEEREINAILGANAEAMAMQAGYNSVVGVENLRNLSRDWFDTLHKKAAQEGQGSLVLLPMANGTMVLPGGGREVHEFGANAAVMSVNQVGLELAGIARGLEAQARGLQVEQDGLLDDLKALATASGENADSERASLQDRIDDIQGRIDDLLATLPVADQVTNWFGGWLAAFRKETDSGVRGQMIDRANAQLRRAASGRWTARDGALLPADEQERVRRAVEMNLGRHPYINTGSFAIAVPQISKEMTERNIHATVYLHQSTLKALGADHDGDTGVIAHEKYLPLEERWDKRRGSQYVEGSRDPDTGRTSHRAVVDMPDNEARYIRIFSEAMADSGSLAAGVVHQHLNGMVRALRTTLGRATGGVVDDAVLDGLLAKFKEDMVANVPSAREDLLNGLLNSSPNAVADLLSLSDGTRTRGMPFVPWFMHTINTQFDTLQRNLATRFQTDPTSIPLGDVEQSMVDTAYMDRIARRDAATAGQQLTNTIEAIRAAQQLHYAALYRTLTLAGARESQESFTTPEQEELVALYARLGSDMTMSELDMTLGKDSIEKNVMAFLDRIVKESTSEMVGRPLPELRLLMANLAVPDIRPSRDGGYTVEVGKTSLLQLLLRKALEIEEQKLTGTAEDTAARLRIAKLRSLAYPKKEGHSYTASTVMVELFGSQSMFDLVGDSAMFLGPEMTLGQLSKMAAGMGSRELSGFFHNLKRSSAYIKDSEIKDPPWTRDQLESGGVNAFSMLMDAVKTYTDTERAAMGRRDATLSENFRSGLDEFRGLLDIHQSRTKGLPAGRDSDSRVAVLRDLLNKRPDVVTRIAALIPEASALGVFQVLESGEVRQAQWLEDVLTMDDSAKAEVLYYVQVKLAEFNQMGGTVRFDPGKDEQDSGGSRGSVRYDQIKSRFLQTVYYLAKDPNSMELMRFLKTASEASSLDALFTHINTKEPDWLNNRAPLLPYHDDVGLFEVRPQDVWTQDLPYALQREALEMFSTSMKVAGDSAREARAIEQENTADLAEMLRVARGESTDARATLMYDQLGELIAHRQNFPDSIGPRARDQLLELFSEALIRLHDKGKIDEAARGFGESLVTMDSFGWKGALMQETDAVTALDWQDVATNLTKLVNGPVRIQLNNGSMLHLDMSDRKKALELLSDPRTQQFAMAVLMPTVRDVNAQGVLQTYRDTGLRHEDANLISKLLAPEALRVSLYEDTGSKVAQAHRYIGQLESYMRNQALNSPQDDHDEYITRNDAAHNPIQHMIDDFLVAYTQGPKWRAADKRKLRDQLVVRVADAIKMMANVEPTAHARIREAVVAALHEQFLGDDVTMDVLGLPDQQRDMLELQMTDFIVRGFKAERDEIRRRREEELATATSQAAKDAINSKYDQQLTLHRERAKEFKDSTQPVLQRSGLMANAVQSTINSMILTGNPIGDIPRKIQILDQLGKQNRVNRFRTKGDIELFHKVRRIIYSDNLAVFRSATSEAQLAGIDDISLEEWNILGGWAAASVISDMTARSGSEVALLPLVLGKGGDLVRRYYDTSGGYLLDGFFDDTLLDAATKLATQAGVKREVSSEEAIRTFTDGLFAPGLLGQWTDRVPIESMKLRKVVETASTGAAIQMEGNDPKSLAAYIAAGRVSTQRPDPLQHHSTLDQAGELGSNLTGWDQLTALRMTNRFVSRVVLDASQLPQQVLDALDPADLDLMPALSANGFNDDVLNSGYKVLNLAALNTRLDQLREKYGPIGPITLHIEYVDPDKMPAGPDDRAWANNIYFVGVGREGYRTSTFGALAALYFGSNGLSKLGQQNPLDAATKKGKRFRALVSPLLRDVEQTELAGRPISEVLWDKTRMMFEANYATGDLLAEDIPALYQLMLMRHVIIGTNASGQKEVWWPQRYIQMEATGATPPLADVKLVPLNDSIAQQLHSGKGHGGLRTRVTQRVLNLQDITPFASLNAERLKDLGLTELGEVAQPWNSPLAQVGVQRHAALVREDQDQSNTIAQRRRRFENHKAGVTAIRSRNRRTGEGAFDPAAISKSNTKRLNEHMAPSVISSLMRKMGVPFADLEGQDRKITVPLLRSLSRQDPSSNHVVWYHDHESGTDLGKGVLGKHAIDTEFADLNGNDPTFEDHVIINVSSIERVNRGGNVEKAVKDVIRSYADRGLKVVLVTDNGRRDTLNAMFNWLDSGAIGYRSIAGSPNFYEPITEDPRDGETRRMLNSTLTQSDVFDTDGVALGLATNELATYLSENGGVADLQYDPGWKRVVANILPARIMATGSVGDETFAFAVPSPDDARSWETIREKLLPVLRTEAGLDHLAQLASNYEAKDPKKAGNPKGVALARTVKNTGEKIPGVQDMREALIELRTVLEANESPLQPGRSAQMGTVLPALGRNGQILLTRVGFNVPPMIRMGEMLDAALGENRKRPGEPGLGIAIAPAKLDKDTTIGPPFTIKEVKTTSRGVVVIGEADISGYAKTIFEGTGFKMGAVPMPSSLRFKDAVMRVGKAAGMRLTRIVSETSLIGKEATPGLVDNFAEMFVVGGINFKNDLMEFFYQVDPKTMKPEEYSTKWDSLQSFLEQWAAHDHGMTAEEIVATLDRDFAQGAFENRVNAMGAAFFSGEWKNAVLLPSAQQPDVNNRIGTVLLATLAAPGVKLEHVLGTPGLITVADHNSGLLVRRLPTMLSDALSDPTYPEVRKNLIGRVNAKMPKRPDGRPIYWFDEQMNFHALVEEQVKGKWTDREVVGQLQVQLPIVNDVNGDTLSMAALTSDMAMSPHVVNVQNATDGGYLVSKGKKIDEQGNLIDTLPNRVDEIFGENEILRFESGDGAVVWDMLRRVMDSDPSYSPWERQLPLAEMHRNEVGHTVRYYTKVIDKPEDDPAWKDKVKADAAADAVLKYLGLTVPSVAANRDEIDFLVRQWYGAPAAQKADEVEAAKISAEEYIQAAKTMLENLKKGMHPLHTADVPLEHVAFWRKVYEAQRNRPASERWAPAGEVRYVDGRVETRKARDWAEWVNVVMGQMRNSAESFDGIFSNALDGFYHTYQGSTPDYLVTALSLDEKKAARLIDTETNRTFLSVDPGRDALYADPIILDSMLVSYEALAGHKPEFTERDAKSAETSPRYRRRQRQQEYRLKNDITKQKERTVRQYAKDGLAFQESSRKTSELLAGMVNLSISMRLANPALYVSAMIEVPFRNMLERSANLLYGTYTGVGAAQVSRVGQKMGIAPRYAPEELAAIDMLVDQLGESNTLLGEIFHEMVYANPMDAKSRAGRALEGLATKVARSTSDPRWGMRANSVARRYVEAALNHLAMTDSSMTVAQFTELLERDPLWLKRNAGEGFTAHRAGVNAVTQVRATRPTVAGRAVMSPIDRMTQSGSGFVNGAGHLLKIPFMFTRFNINTLATLTGLDALDQVAALMMDGRKAPELVKRMGALSRMTEYDRESAPRMDYSDVLQGIDISRIFVRSAVTQTGLMAAALMAAGQGLGGEDEEEARRRKLATYLNIPFIRDPREAQNDFRFKDAVFLDNIPLLNTWFHREDIDRSVVVPHWILRQFLSPVLGTMRFFQTGDVGEIRAGFQDAIGVIPNSALNLWREADGTAMLLAAAAQDASLDPQKDQQVNQFIINIVGIYEKALLENQFVNSLRQAMDPVDRNPWLMPMTAEENTGQLDRLQGSDLPQETNALVDIVTEGDNGQDPEQRKAYLTREVKSAQLHAYAESNGTFALLASLLTGGTSSSFLRRNMVPKQRIAAVDEASKSEVEAAVLSAFQAQGGQPVRTHREILQQLRDRETAAGRFWDNEALNDEADAIFAAEQALAYTPSIFDAEAQAIVNTDHEMGMFKSLHAGLVNFGDPITAGFWASPETRDAIAREWLTELVEEGMALGLSQDSAKYRADRFWWGDEREGWVGLRELLYSSKIPRKGEAEYLQQNVTYVLGPDGKPWATPFEKANLLGTVVPYPNQLVDPGPGLALDSRGNVIDLTRNINTGMAGLLQLPQEPEDIKPNDDILDEIKNKDFGDGDATSKKFARWPRRSYSGGGYGGSSYGPNFQRMLPLPEARNTPRPDDIPFININTPYVRRARVNTERITSERGRLKQWQ